MEKERSIQRIVIRVIWQSVLSLLIGIGIFYLAAPHSTEHGIIIEPLLIAFLIIIGLAIVLILKFFLKKKITLLCFIFYCTGIITAQQFYPISDRFEETSVDIENKINVILEKEFSNIKRIEVTRRAKEIFDPFRSKIWVVTIYTDDESYYKKVYIRESVIGNFSLIK